MAEAVFEIHRCRGTQFDPEAVDALLSVVRLHWASVTSPANRRIRVVEHGDGLAR